MPLYTAFLSPLDYGILGVVSSVSSLMAVFITLGLEAAAARFYYKYNKDEDQAKKLYGNLDTFRKDIDTLIDYGFIKQIVSGVPTMSVSIYGFSHRWKDYGTDNFFIPNEDRRYKRKPKEKK